MSAARRLLLALAASTALVAPAAADPVSIAVAVGASFVSAAGATTAAGVAAGATFGAALGAAVTSASVIASAVIGGALAGAGQLLGGANRPRRAAPNVAFSQDMPVLDYVFGRTRVGGALAFTSENEGLGTARRNVVIVVALALHEIDALEEMWDGATRMWSLAGGWENGYGVGEGQRFVAFDYRLGAPGQTAIPFLETAVPSKLDANFKLTGRPHVALVYANPGKRWPNGVAQNLWFRVRGAKCRDPRTGQRVWTANLPLCAAQFVEWHYGSRAAVDEAHLVGEANLADEDVALEGGGTQKRYELHGAWSSGLDGRAILTDMLRYAASEPVWTGAKIRLPCNAYRAPILSLGAADFRGSVRIEGQTVAEARFDGVSGSYGPQAQRYLRAGFERIVLDDFTGPGAPRLLPLDLSREPDHRRAQRVAVLTLRGTRRVKRVSVPVALTRAAASLAPGDRITLTQPEIGLTGVWEVRARRTVYDPDRPRVEIEAVEDDVGFHAFSADTATAAPPQNSGSLPDPGVVEPPSAVTVTAQRRTEPDGSVTRWLEVAWAAAPDPGGYLDGYVVRWTQAERVRTQQVPGLQFDILNAGAGVGVTVEVAARNSLGILSAFVGPGGAVTPGGDVTPPGVPASAAIFAAVDGFAFEVAASTAPDWSHFNLYEGAAGAAFADCVRIDRHASTRFSRLGLTPGQVRRYFITSVDRSGNESAPFGPLQDTVRQLRTGDIQPGAITTALLDPVLQGVISGGGFDPIEVEGAVAAAQAAQAAAEAAADAADGFAILAEAASLEAAEEAQVARNAAGGQMLITGSFDAALGAWTAIGGGSVTRFDNSAGVSLGRPRWLLRSEQSGTSYATEAIWRNENLNGRTIRMTGWAGGSAGNLEALTMGIEARRLSDGATIYLSNVVAQPLAALARFTSDLTVAVEIDRWRPVIGSLNTGAGTDVYFVGDLRFADWTQAAAAVTQVTLATAKATEAASSASAAQAALTTATARRDEAAASASAASGFSSSASSSASQAGASATAAASSATAATARRDEAAGHAATALAQAANATASASNATLALTATANLATGNLISKPDFEDGVVGPWTNGAPTVDTSAPSGFTRSLRGTANVWTATRLRLNLAGRRFRVSGRATTREAGTPNTRTVRVGLYGFSSIGAAGAVVFSGVTAAPADSPWVQFSAEVDGGSTTTVEVAPAIVSPAVGSDAVVWRVTDLRIEDITDAYAASTSAQAAQVSRDAAGVSASAAQTERVAAQAARDAAAGSASAAATSATTAGVKSTEAAEEATAAQTARLAAETARNNAQTSATAAATSATTASSRATEAAASASASQSSRLAAEAAAGAAAGSASVASTAQVAASNSAAAAETARRVAVALSASNMIATSAFAGGVGDWIGAETVGVSSAPSGITTALWVTTTEHAENPWRAGSLHDRRLRFTAEVNNPGARDLQAGIEWRNGTSPTVNRFAADLAAAGTTWARRQIEFVANAPLMTSWRPLLRTDPTQTGTIDARVASIRMEDVTTPVAERSAAVEELTDAFADADAVQARYLLRTVAVAGGRRVITGFGFTSAITEGGTPESLFEISASTFRVTDPNGANPTSVFEVSGGVVRITNAAIGTANIDRLNIAGQAVDYDRLDIVNGATGAAPSVSASDIASDLFGGVWTNLVSLVMPRRCWAHPYVEVNFTGSGDCNLRILVNGVERFLVNGVTGNLRLWPSTMLQVLAGQTVTMQAREAGAVNMGVSFARLTLMPHLW